MQQFLAEPDYWRAHIARWTKPNGDCLEWQRYCNTSGYGRISTSRYDRDKGDFVYAHRLAWALAHGVDPGELQVLHTCDNRKCANAAHLYAGTEADNKRDMWERNPSFLSSADVATIHFLRRQGYTQKAIGERLGVTQSAISYRLRNPRAVR